jgi:hypothetical protein
VIAEIAVLVTAIATLLTALGGMFVALKYVVPTHKIVNSEKTDRLRFIAALEQALRVAGVAIPVDQSLPIPPFDKDDPNEQK